MALTFSQPYPPHGRIEAYLGEFLVGTIVVAYAPYSWTIDVPGHLVSGKARSEVAAKSALSHALHDWVRRAGLQEVPA